MRTFPICHRFTAGLTACLLLLALPGCASYTPAPTFPTDDPSYMPGGVARDGMDADPPLSLQLIPGDTITVRTISNESFEYPGLVVDSQGMVHVPMAGPIDVKGLAPQQAEEKIQESLRRFDRFVRVSVLVTAWGGHTATVIGAVAREGTISITPRMRMAELVASAGGLLRTGTQQGVEPTYIADLEAARVLRDGVALPISLRLALDGYPRHNVYVHPGDQVFIPAGLGSRIAVLGNVTAGGVMLTHRPGIRLTEALATAGGITIDADDQDIRIVRGPIADPTVYEWSFQDLVEDKTGDVELAPGDVVFVSEHWVAQMGEVLERIAPLLTVLTTGVTTYLTIRQLQEINERDPIVVPTSLTAP